MLEIIPAKQMSVRPTKFLVSFPIVFLAALLLVLFSVTVVGAQQTTLPYIEIVRPEGETVHEIAWKPDGSVVALAAGDEIWLYTNTLQEIAQLQGHTDEVTSIDWSPDGTRLASASTDTTIRIWNMEEGSSFGSTETILQGHTDWVLGVRWSPVGNKLASIALDRTISPLEFSGPFNTIWIWDIPTEQTISTLPSYAGSIALAWSPDGTLLATAGTTIDDNPATRIWDVSTGSLQYALPTGGEKMVSSVAWSHNGQLLGIGSEWSFVLVADVSRQDYLSSLDAPGGVNTVTWNPDDTLLAGGDQLGNLVIWDVATAQVLVNIQQAHSGLVRMAQWSPDGTKIASISSIDNTLRVWDTTRPGRVPSLTGTTMTITTSA